MRTGELLVLACVSVTGALGCGVESQAYQALDPSAEVRANAGAVRCAADEEGNLHVHAPPGARVTLPPDAPEGATAEIAYGGEDHATQQMPRPVRPRSISLGFIGDGKLTETPNHGDRWSYGTHDNLLPPHAHGAWVSSHGYGYGYGYGHGGAGYGYGYPRGYGSGTTHGYGGRSYGGRSYGWR